MFTIMVYVQQGKIPDYPKLIIQLCCHQTSLTTQTDTSQYVSASHGMVKLTRNKPEGALVAKQGIAAWGHVSGGCSGSQDQETLG